MYYSRTAEQLTLSYLKQFRILGIMGPRQSGKSTMIKHLLQNGYTYITFDKLENRIAFKDDPIRFMKLYDKYVIFDEAQQISELFPAIKIVVDENPDIKGRFVLTGSGQFLLSKNISESLAGRIGLITLLPMQYTEVPENHQEKHIIQGGYPDIAINDWNNSSDYFNSYLNTYLQKDLRQMLNVSDLSAFTQLIRILATRVGQNLNLTDISKETGITISTLSKWISVLEASYIIYLLRPFHNNLGKRLVKTPKVYFYDNGLLCFLLGINSISQWQKGLLAGAIFENFIITEVQKELYHKGYFADLYFIRTSHGDEIDLVIDFRNTIKLVEIKMSQTYKVQFHKIMDKLSETSWSKNVIYMGDTHQVADDVKAWNYMDFFRTKLDEI